MRADRGRLSGSLQSGCDLSSLKRALRSARCPLRWHRWPDLNLPAVTQAPQLRMESASDAQPSPLPPSPLSHRSARCVGICRPNHCCDTGQSHTHTHARASTRTRWRGPRMYAQDYLISFKAPPKYNSLPVTLVTNKTGLCVPKKTVVFV